MARNSSSKVQKRRQSAEAKGGRVRRRTKVCYFCAEKVDWVDYKDTTLLRRFINDRGRIKARTATGTCAQHQRDVAVAVKTARELVLLPYVVRTQSPERGDRRGRRPRPDAENTQTTETEAGGESGDGTPATPDAPAAEAEAPASA